MPSNFESKIRRFRKRKKNIATTIEEFSKYPRFPQEQNIQLPCHVTGVEEVEWERRIYNRLLHQKTMQSSKKTQPSHTY
jgi:ABC-type lipoprotein export system ATPase subunit